MFNQLHSLPDGLLDLPAAALAARLGGPTLIELPGRREPPLFVALLLHGNEDTGWEATRELLKGYDPGGGPRELPRSLVLFIGNVAAASQGLRHLDGQPDYNRIWPGAQPDGSPEQAMTREIVARMHGRGLFASVDLHNNTGLNPHYACVNRIEHRFLHLATLFSRTVVYFTRPEGVQSLAFAELCPAVTLECGKVGSEHGVGHAREFLDACLHLADHPGHPVAPRDIDLFHTVARVQIPESVAFGFGGREGQLQFVPDLDRLNFRELPAGTELARVDDTAGLPLAAWDEQGRDRAAHFFRIENGQLRLRVPVMPSMLTRDARVIRQDCLGYLMERYDAHLPDGAR